MFQAASLIGAPDELALAVAPHTLGGTGETFPDPSSAEQEPDAGHEVHLRLYEGLIGITPQEYEPPESLAGLLTPVVNAMSSPLSGVITGVLSPAFSPWVALFNSVGAVFDDVTGDNPQAALGDLLNTPAAIFGGFVNGATLNVDWLVPTLNRLLLAEDTTENLEGLRIGFGGLFSPGVVVTGVGGEANGVGGSLLNTFGWDMDVHELQRPELGPEDGGFLGHTHIFDNGLGPIAAFAGLAEVIGQVFGGDLPG